jgi:tetratricopeptide (TPR) repeat protein
VKKQSLITWALIAAVSGCAMPGVPGYSNRSAQLPNQSRQMARQPSGPMGAAPSWTERVNNFLTGPFQPASAQTTAARQQELRNDPVSLDYPSAPPTSELFFSMAKMSDRNGNTEHARSMYLQALAIEPNRLDAVLGLARLEDREGRFNEAQKIYQQATAAHPQNAKVLNDLGLCYARNGQFEPSIWALDQAVRRQPTKALYRNNIAKVLAQVERVDEAVAHLSAVHPPAVAQYNMGVLLQQRGKTFEAIHFLTAASHIDPQMQPAHVMLADLRGKVSGYPTNDNVLPTPVAPQPYGQNMPGIPRYTAPPVTTSWPQPQQFPTSTAQVPQGYSPVSLPPIR